LVEKGWLKRDGVGEETRLSWCLGGKVFEEKKRGVGVKKRLIFCRFSYIVSTEEQ
jgi:hypothetical protein